MKDILLAWLASAVVLILLAVLLGTMVKPRVPFGILLDNRGRYSLTHLQLVLWTILILSLVSGIFWGRLIAGVAEPLSFKIPSEVLGLLGISVGSAVLASTVKASKNASNPQSVAASSKHDLPSFSQIFMVEEGEQADQVVDVTKYQNFIITLILIAAYTALAIHAVKDAASAEAVESLPKFSETFLVLVGISQAAYVGGKVVPAGKGGEPEGLTLANRAAVAAGNPPPGFEPRNAPPPVPAPPAPVPVPVPPAPAPPAPAPVPPPPAPAPPLPAPAK
jgi:hypothetical protein